MNEKQGKLFRLKSCLNESLRRLQNDDELTQEECTAIINELEVAKSIPETTATTMEGPMGMSIDELIQDFHISAEKSTQFLQDMLGKISEGKVPENESVEKLNLSIKTLQQKYSSISQYVSSQVSEEEMPALGSSVAELVNALENSKTIQYQKQLDEIRTTLEQFISVRSLIDAFSSALYPFQQKAEELLSKINGEEELDFESIGNENAGPTVFMEALRCEDVDSQENIEILEHVLEYYPTRVYTGLLSNKYYIDNDALNAYESKEKENISAVSSLNKERYADNDHIAELEKESPMNTAQPVDKEAETVGNEEDTEAIHAETDSEEIAVIDEEEKEESEFVKKLIGNNAFIQKDENIGFLTKEVSQAEGKKISSSVVLNDIRRGSEKAAKKVILSAIKSNCISAGFLALEGMPLFVAESTLADLHKRGYLRKYGLATWGSFYCISPRLVKALGYKDVRKLVGIRQFDANDFGTDIPDKETSAAARIAFINTFTAAHEAVLSNWDVLRYSTTVGQSTDSFCFRLFDTDAPEHCIFAIGAFWDNPNDCDEDFKGWEEVIQICEGIHVIVIAGIDTARAKSIATAFMDSVDYDLSQTKVVLYSLSDQGFYEYDSLDSIEQADAFGIWNEETVAPSEPAQESEEKQGEGPDEGSLQTVEDRVEVGTQSDNTPENTKDMPEMEAVTIPIVEEESSDSKELVTKPSKKSVKKEGDGYVPTEVVRNNAFSMLAAKKFYAATAYTKAVAASSQENQALYDLISYAVNDPMAHCVYSTDNAFNLISKRSMFDDAMIISVAIRTFFSNQVRYDYQIKAFYNGIKEYSVLNQFPSLNNVLYSLMEFKDEHKKGMDAYASYRAKSQAQLEKEIAKVRNDARDFYNNFVVGRKKENASQKRFLETKKLMFDVNSDLGVYIKAVADSDHEMLPLMIDFLKTEFLNDDGFISEDSINDGKLWEYIVRYWDMAGENMMYKRHADLMSRLKSNITNITMKAVQLLVRWCALMEQAGNHKEDEGTVSYRRKSGPLLENLKKAIEEINGVCLEEISDDERAGLRVLENTLDIVRRCIDGSYEEYERKFFYSPFLLTDDVMLDENFYPDLDVHGTALTAISPVYRIQEHLRKLERDENSYAERLREILEQQGDDYGAARLIVEYLSDVDPSFSAGELESAIDTGVSYARDAAEVRKNDFIGELELAQSYGQIDNSEEDKKEKILQIIDEWYEWAESTSDFGFFRKVMDSYIAEIREEAKAREADLLEQLEAFRTTKISGLTTEAKEKRVKRIQKMIQEQNYTVAEVLLARTTVEEDETEDIIDEDFLKEFLYNYDDYYRPVATHKSSFSSLVSSRTRNKEERGAKRLADNWLPGGSKLGIDRLKNLLGSLGFKVGSVKDTSSNNRFETYIVMTAVATGGQRENYTHPIAAFGSGASQDGFRVVCINGGYDADGLIDLMKQIGNSKHTLILHDHALSLSERRRLARKSKNALGDKFFGVIDRTVMMFLVRNYEETKINRMLISLIMPFGYYQPYVWESANVMPPEIFMGRKIELEKIKSPTGVNIVYGGRQLGKSALLKKAKDDVDWDENGNRAVYIDIKGLNYEEAARKIGHELYDQYILPNDIDTTDWSELARAIRRRLQDQTKKIPYLLLLLDEADTFIESCEIVNYKPMDALKEIQSMGANRFKFVIAGLRNIVRFKRELALGNNSVLTHLESMTVRPFNTTEARELMEIPLHYLGLQFPKAKESLITLILANTNYFPGLIQMYCAKLLEAMRNKDYAGYNEADTPIYEVSEAHIKKVLADPEFMQQIREKYVITLKLDEDNYYYLIALIMAYLYHRNGYNEGYSAEDIHNAGKELDINKISELSISKLTAFMEELNELNVLRSIDDTRYLFTRFTFFQMMGTASEVEDKLVEYMEG